ncbi:hypothetical protein [Bacillus alkalicellulosilyticus]|nr:hypothetical protein [Bacillus alkalicellulosilyticus]
MFDKEEDIKLIKERALEVLRKWTEELNKEKENDEKNLDKKVLRKE